MDYYSKYRYYKDRYLATGGIYAPEKYLAGLTKAERKQRLKRIEEGSKSSSSDPHAYRPFKTDFRNGEKIKTRLSGYTQQWERYFPGVTSLEDKALVTGVPLSILNKIYAKGNAAWRTGHRPGATQQQWGHARVNSFLVKGKTFYTADRQLALECLKNAESRRWFNSIDGLCDKPDPEEWCSEDAIDMGRKQK